MLISRQDTSDARAVARALAGDERGFEALVARHQRRVHALARAHGVPPSAVDDVAQDVFIRAFRQLTRLRDPRRFGPWILAIARNEARRHRRPRGALVDPVSLEERTVEDRRSDPLEAAELRDRLARRVEALSPAIREAIFLYYYEGRSISESSRALEASCAAVRKRLQQGRDLLRGRLWRDLGEEIRENIPSTREWSRKGRELTLLALAAVPAAAASAGGSAAGGGLPGAVTSARGSTPAKALTYGAGFLMAKKLAGVALTVLLGWLWLVPDSRPPSDGEPSFTGAPLAATAPVPAASLPPAEGPAATPPERRPTREEIDDEGVDAVREPASMLVRVVDEEGSPIAGASVLAWQWIHRWSGKFPIFPDGPARRLATSVDGLARFAEIDPGRYSVEVWRPDMSGPDQRVTIAGGEEIELTVTLRPAKHIEGRAFLVDRSRPLRNGIIERFGDGRPRTDTVETDAEGRFLLGPFSHEGTTSFQLRHGDYRVATVSADIGAERPAKLEVVFAKGVTVRGRVDDLSGRPVAGAVVAWHREHTEHRTRLSTTTGEHGLYELYGLEPGTYFVGFEELCFGGDPIVKTLSDEPLQEVPLVVDCAPVFEVVVESAEGEPLPEVEIDLEFSVRRANGGLGGRRTLITGADGRATLRCVPRQARFELEVADPRFGHAKGAVPDDWPDGPVVVRLEPITRLDGRVLDRDGNPVAGALLSAQHGTARPVEHRSGEDGLFSLRLVPGSYRIEAVDREIGGALVRDLELASGNSRELDIVLGTSPVLRVRVIGPEGLPLKNARVRHSYAGSQHAFLTHSTDAEGWCVFPVTEGRYRVRASSRGLEDQEVEAVPGDPITIVLRLEPRGFAVSGVVLDGEMPVPGATVDCRAADSSSAVSWCREARADAEGRFRIENVDGRSGSVARLVARGPGFACAFSDPLELPLNAPLDGVIIRVQPGLDFEARLVVREGRSVPRAAATLRGDEGGPERFVTVSATSDARGVLRVPRLPPGRYVVRGESADQMLSFREYVGWTGAGGDLVWTFVPWR